MADLLYCYLLPTYIIHGISMQLDPIDSPYPVPWNWVMATLTDSQDSPRPTGVHSHFYRSPSLVSPDGTHAAYSRMQMQVEAEFYRSQVSSVLFVENLTTRDLQTVIPAAPLSDNPFSQTEDLPLGAISMVIPVAWSAAGDRLLARTFESLFCTDLASDYAVLVDCVGKRVQTLAPSGMEYTTAVLLGWSAQHPDRALFRVGHLGRDDWPLYTVAPTGTTQPAAGDRPATFGAAVSNVWMGPQISR